MQDSGGFYGPLAYGAWWGWAGAVVLALVAAWFAWVLLSTRKPTPGRTVRLAPQADGASLRATCLEQMDAVAENARSGRIPLRTAHQELSLLLRKYVRDASGVDAPRMTLDEISRHSLPGVAAALQQLYPAEFGPEPLPSIDASAAAAKAAVVSWN